MHVGSSMCGVWTQMQVSGGDGASGGRVFCRVVVVFCAMVVID